MKDTLKNIKLLTLILLFTAFGISGLIFLGIKLVDQEAGTNIGDYGGYVNGLFGTALSLIAVVLIYQTYHLQEKELKETREILSQQQFFSLLEMLKSNTSEIGFNEMLSSGDLKRHIGLNAINFMYKKYHKLFNLKDNTFNKSFICHINESEKDENKLKLKVIDYEYDDDGNVYEQFDTIEMANAIRNWISVDLRRENILLKKVEYEIQRGHHEAFHKLVRTVKFIWNIISKKDEHLKSFYFELLLSQLTQSQLILMFYSCLLHEEFNSLHSMFKDPLLYNTIKSELLLKPRHLHNFTYNTNYYSDTY